MSVHKIRRRPGRLRMLLLLPPLGVLLFLLLLFFVLRFTPYPELDHFRVREWSREYLDRYGALLYVQPLANGMRRIFRDLDEMPDSLVSTFLDAEDRRFYLHPGIDPLAVLRSAVLNLHEGRIVSGASTITMQLARIIETESGGGWSGFEGKLRETWNSFRLESRLSKRELLQLWINAIPFGFRCEGVPAAGMTFFNRPVEELSPAQFALLSVIPRSPSLYDPVEHPETAARAAAKEPGIKGRFSYRELLSAAREARRGVWTNQAPHFINYFNSIAPVRSKDLRVKTSIDAELNMRLRERIDQTLDKHSRNRLGNGAGLIVRNDTGEIISWVGSREFWDDEHQGQIDGVLVRNQPGSTLKPFLYTLAIRSGFLPNSILPDLPLELGGAAVYQPFNFDRRFHGPVRLRVALASSLNVPAVYLIERLGVDAFAQFLVDLGFSSIKEQRGSLGTGLALGNAEVSLFELVHGYTLFSRTDGPVPLRPLPVELGSVESSEIGLSSSRDRYAVAVVRDILGDNRSRVLGFGSDSVMNLAFPSLFKTGTANQFQNIWAIGAIPEYTVGVWIGNFTGETVIGKTGSSIPASIVAELLDVLHKPDSGYPAIPGAVRVKICAVSGMAATADDPSTLYEYLPPDRLPDPCTWHHRDERGKLQVSYPDIFRVWAQTKRSGAFVAAREGEAEGEIVFPPDGSRFFADPSLSQEAQAVRIEGRGLGPPPYALTLYRHGMAVLQRSSNLPLFLLPFPEKGAYRIVITGSGGCSAESGFEVW